MEVTTAYLYVVNTLPQILESVQKAQVPEKFTHAFLQALGYKSTNDRAFINVWKGLGFLDGNSVPTPQVTKNLETKLGRRWRLPVKFGSPTGASSK